MKVTASPAEIAILDNTQKLELVLDSLADIEQMWAVKKTAHNEAEYAHKMKRAQEYLKAEGTIKEREMLSDVNCGTEMELRFRTEAENDIAFQKLLDVRTVISARQSILNAETKRPY